MTAKHTDPGGNRQILEEASAWFVEFRLAEVDNAARRRFLRWLRRSPEHIRAYMEISGAYARLPTPGSASDTDIEALIERARGRATVVAFGRGDQSAAMPPGSSRHEQSWRSRVAFRRVAVGLAMCAGIAMAGWWLAVPHPPTYETQTAERRSITLEDGSSIELNARTQVRVNFTPARRTVELLEGQALFKVAKDPHRPFFVSSSQALVRAVGTQFDVDRKESGTTVTVVEGRVTVQSSSLTRRPEAAPQVAVDRSTGSAGATPPLELSAGEQLIVTPTRIDRRRRSDPVAVTAWTQGQLEFDETPLQDVVFEFNRYSRRPLVIESASLAALRVNGVYSATDTAALILFLQRQPDIQVTETDADIRITAK